MMTQKGMNGTNNFSHVETKKIQHKWNQNWEMANLKNDLWWEMASMGL
jgi:hypothetical protein